VASEITIGLAFLLGSILGSFLNVCIVRLPADESVIRPASRCPRCRQPIARYDNIPILSWLVLRGRCRRCGESISWQYPLIELVTGAMWAATVWWWGPTITAVTGAIFGTILLGIAVTDARHYLIPDEFTIGGAVIGLALSLSGGYRGLLDAVIGAALGFGLLFLVGAVGRWMFKEEAMGGGDIKMMAMVGTFVGWKGVLLTIFLGALAGSLVFVPLTLRKKRLVPFGVFLAVGAAVTFLAGDVVIRWYLNFVQFG
jgi:leader peptidase (prepilin peptidase)/N-methyltransferase